MLRILILSEFRVDNANDGSRSIFSFVRKSPTGRNNIRTWLTFTPVDRADYRVGVAKEKTIQADHGRRRDL